MVLGSAVRTVTLAHRIKASFAAVTVYGSDRKTRHLPAGNVLYKGRINKISGLDDLSIYLTVVDPPGTERQMKHIAILPDLLQTPRIPGHGKNMWMLPLS